MKNPFAKIKFLKSPTGTFNLAYRPGDVAELPLSRCEVLVESGFAEFAEPEIKAEPKPKAKNIKAKK
jgi:hypothetical protein